MTGWTVTKLRGRWQAVTPLLLLATQLAAVGQGSTIFHQQFVTPDPLPWFPWDSQGQRVVSEWGLDMNLDGQAEFTFVGDGETFQVLPSGNNAVLSYTFGPGGINAWALPLPSLTPISADPGDYTWFQRIDSPFGSAGSVFVGYTSELSTGSFLGIESAYVGLQFMLDDGIHYGWVRMGCPVDGLAGGWIYEAAYDLRPGMPILTGVVPEPCTVALLVLSGVGFWLFNRRR